jgi:hypothetical protein
MARAEFGIFMEDPGNEGKGKIPSEFRRLGPPLPETGTPIQPEPPQSSGDKNGSLLDKARNIFAAATSRNRSPIPTGGSRGPIEPHPTLTNLDTSSAQNVQYKDRDRSRFLPSRGTIIRGAIGTGIGVGVVAAGIAYEATQQGVKPAEGNGPDHGATVIPGGVPSSAEATATLVDTRVTPTATSEPIKTPTPEPTLAATPEPTRASAPATPGTPRPATPDIKPTATEQEHKFTAETLYKTIIGHPVEVGAEHDGQKEPLKLNNETYIMDAKMKADTVAFIKSIGMDPSALSDAQLADFTLQTLLLGRTVVSNEKYPNYTHEEIAALNLAQSFNAILKADGKIPFYGYKSEEGDAGEKAQNPYDVTQPLEFIVKQPKKPEDITFGKAYGIVTITKDVAEKTVIDEQGKATVYVYISADYWAQHIRNKTQKNGGNFDFVEVLTAIPPTLALPEIANGSTDLRVTNDPGWNTADIQSVNLLFADVPNPIDGDGVINVRGSKRAILYK